MELRFHTSDEQMQRLQERTHVGRAVDVARHGLDLLDWATEEVSAGYRVVAVNDAGAMRVPVMGVLNRVRDGGERA